MGIGCCFLRRGESSCEGIGKVSLHCHFAHFVTNIHVLFKLNTREVDYCDMLSTNVANLIQVSLANSYCVLN